MSQPEGSVNNQFIHLQMSNNEVTMRGVPLCDLGHQFQGTRSGETEGIYAGWEWNGRRLRVFNDRFGFYPLYYFVRPGACAVSPSLPELLALSAPTDLDYNALAVFFRVIVKSGVQQSESSGDLVRLCCLDSIREFHARGDFGQVVTPA
ncbi:MAG: hypothetical protein WBK08_10275, partial [Nitrospira sp.]